MKFSSEQRVSPPLDIIPILCTIILKLVMTVPVYDIPESPILIVGFLGILFTLVLLYFVNRDYFASPLNRDRRTK